MFCISCSLEPDECLCAHYAPLIGGRLNKDVVTFGSVKGLKLFADYVFAELTISGPIAVIEAKGKKLVIKNMSISKEKLDAFLFRSKLS
jgi:hypothetical protein